MFRRTHLPDVTVLDLAAAISAREPFALSRWGDGEWRTILHPTPWQHNCFGHPYYHDLSRHLIQILRTRPKYLLGWQTWPDPIQRPWLEWLEAEGLTDIEWVDSNLFHIAAGKGDFRFADWPTVMVGPRHVLNLFPDVYQVEIPPRECWLSTDRVLHQLRKHLDSQASSQIVGYCASMSANAWVHWMHASHPESTHIDFGHAFNRMPRKTLPMTKHAPPQSQSQR